MVDITLTADETTVVTKTYRKIRLRIQFTDPLLGRKVTFNRPYMLVNVPFPQDLAGDLYHFLYYFYQKHIGNGWNTLNVPDHYNELRPEYLTGSEADEKKALSETRRKKILKACKRIAKQARAKIKYKDPCR